MREAPNKPPRSRLFPGSVRKTRPSAGKAVHDARIVAAMRSHSITNVLTFNIADFRRYSDIIHAVVPEEIQ